MSVNEAPSFSSIPDVIEGSEVWMRGPLSKLPPLSDPVPSDWIVVEGNSCFINIIKRFSSRRFRCVYHSMYLLEFFHSSFLIFKSDFY